jgi:tyrosinase
VGLRKNQANLNLTEKTAFVDALLVLKQRPSRLHPTSPNRSRYDDFVEVHLDAMNVMMTTPPAPSWGHMAAAFSPWHRVLLMVFERELQSVNPAVTLPYWDWTVDQSPTGSLWKPDFLGGSGGGLQGRVTDGKFAGSSGQWPINIKDEPTTPNFLRRQLGVAADARNLPSAARQAQVLTLTPYDVSPWDDMLRDQQNAGQWGGFRIGLEIPLHNLVHRWVGGNMLDMSSPNDPVFWLHHCNLDRLWAVWQFAHPTIPGYLPGSGGPAGHNINDKMIFHAPGDAAPWDGEFRPIDVIDHRTLGISYDTDPVAGPPIVVPQPQPVDAREAERLQRQPRATLPMFALPDEIAGLRGAWG